MLETEGEPGVSQVQNMRREGRETAKGFVEIEDTSYPLVDWSASGFKASGFAGGFARGDRVPVEFSIELDGETYFFICKAFIVWASTEQAAFAGAFVEMDQGDRLAISQYFEQGV